MKEQALTRPDTTAVEKVFIHGDLSTLSPDQRLDYYRSVCDSLGLNPLTKPFDYIKLNGKLTLYATKNATDQLRKLYGVSVCRVEKELDEDGVYTVTAYAKDQEGREDVDQGAVYLGRLTGEARANALVKAITRAKRRVTLSMCGLGFLDETEVETIPSAEVAPESRELEPAEIVSPSERAPLLEDKGSVSQRQRGRIFAMLDDQGRDKEKFREWVHGEYQIETFNDLSEVQAERIIERLKKAKAGEVPFMAAREAMTPEEVPPTGTVEDKAAEFMGLAKKAEAMLSSADFFEPVTNRGYSRAEQVDPKHYDVVVAEWRKRSENPTPEPEGAN